MRITSRLMDQIPLVLDYKLKLDAEDDQFWTSCTVEPFEASILNGFLGSQFFVQFKSGKIDRLHFEFEGNKKANVGSMDLEYSALKVQKLQGHEKYIQGKPKTGFLASMANMFIPTNRSMDQKNYKTAVIYYKKEYNRDIIHGTIQSLISGIMSSVGFATKNLEKQQAKAAALDEPTEPPPSKANKKADKEKKK